MIYFVEDFYFPDFGGFGWTEGARYCVPEFAQGMYAINTSATWEEIADLHHATYPQRRQPKLCGTAGAVSGKNIVALGQLILPRNFFRIPDTRYDPPHEGARQYRPLEPWEVQGVNMDGDTDWVKQDPARGDGFHEPLGKVFAKLTPDLEGQLWVDWQRHPPKQQMLAQHWATEVQARNALAAEARR